MAKGCLTSSWSINYSPVGHLHKKKTYIRTHRNICAVKNCRTFDTHIHSIFAPRTSRWYPHLQNSPIFSEGSKNPFLFANTSIQVCKWYTCFDRGMADNGFSHPYPGKKKRNDIIFYHIFDIKAYQIRYGGFCFKKLWFNYFKGFCNTKNFFVWWQIYGT